MKNAIGIDVGGTNIRAARVNEKGTIELIQTCASTDQGPEKLVEILTEMIDTVKDGETIGIGLAMPGPVDETKGCITLSSNLKGCANYPFVDVLQYKTHLPVSLINDANAAALAEACVGAGNDCDIVYYMTLSTGIGGGLVINRKVYNGIHGYAGEVGNIVIDPAYPDAINNLAPGAMESHESCTALVRRAKECGLDVMHAGHVFELADHGNEKAKGMVVEFQHRLARLIATIIMITDPACIVLGGGMMQSSSYFLDEVRSYCDALIQPTLRPVDIRCAQCEQSGVIGAAMVYLGELV